MKYFLFFILGVLLMLVYSITFSKFVSPKTNESFLEKKIDSLMKRDPIFLKQRDTLEKQIITIHNGTKVILEKIIITPDSNQYIITKELIREHRRLDSL